MVNLHLVRDLARARVIVGILLKYRFDEFLREIDTPAAWLARMVPAVKGSLGPWRRVRLAVEELGPTFIKAAQLLSTRPDILPAELINELRQLRDQVTPVPFEKMRVLLENELGGPLEDEFLDFNPNPVAAGSVGQIYRAKLRSSGRPVAVKVQRPGLKRPVLADLEIIGWFARQMHDKIPGLRPFDLPAVIEELRNAVLSELDFTVEARNATVFNQLNRFKGQVFAPEVIEPYTTARLIVTDWVTGRPPDRVELEPAERRRLAVLGGSSFFSQIVQTGFFHGDPHPGNLLVTPDGRLALVDWGLAGQLTREMRYHLVDLFAACAERNAPEVTRIALRLSRNTRRIDRAGLEKAVTAALFRHEEDLGSMKRLGQVIFTLIYVFGSNGIHVARDYALLAKAVLSIEETARALDPDFNLTDVGRPYIKQLTWERWNPGNLARTGISNVREKLARLADLPDDLQRLLHRMEDEELTIRLEHRNLDTFGGRVDAAFSRLALAVIIGSILIGSSMLIHSGNGPKILGLSYPTIGFFGYVVAFIFGIYLVIDIIRHRSHR